MASLPAQHAQRRSSPEETSSQSHQQTPHSPIRARSATSEDSQTLFLNTPDQSPPAQEAQQQQQEPKPEPIPQAIPRNIDDDPSIKKCWICFSDSTEDDPSTSAWRDPCPCALVAHEECLLDWIADTEAPQNRRNRTSIGAPRIECPQCKSEIKLARPSDYVVDAVRGMERLGAKMLTPGALTVLSATIYNSSLAWGMHSIYAIFGAEDGYRILRPLLRNVVRPPTEVFLGELGAREAAQKVLGLFVDHLVHWRLYVGLPLITPVLILSRTSLADSILPVLPILFFATQSPSPDDTLDFTHWPPSASLAFAVLPYVRSAYNSYYQRVWAAKEARWMKEIQPRNGQGQSDGTDAEGVDGGAGQAVQEEAGEENIFEVRIDGGIFEEWEEEVEEEEEGQPPAAQAAPPLHQPPLQEEGEAQEDQAQPPPNIPDHRAPRPAPQPQRHQPPPRQQQQQQPRPAAQNNNANGERRLSFSPTTMASTVLGALLFPTLAGLSGELLKLILPLTWTTPPAATNSLLSRFGGARVSTKGLLQEKWGRSLVGGCLFVVCKDALMLYVRWRMAEMHRGRRVLDWDRAKGGNRGRRRGGG